MKERVTITLDSEMLKMLDKQVDGFQVKNRSHAIELMIHKSMKADKPTTALIMAAGKVTSIDTPQGKIPLKMAQINGKPVVEHIIDLFKKHGVTKIVLALCFQKQVFKDYFGDGSKFGVDIKYIEEDKPSGTSSLLRRIEPYINGPFFVTNADELKDLNLADMYKFHKSNNSIGTIALTTVDDPSSYGMVGMQGNRITSFTEKPRGKETESKIINSGIYLFDPEIFKVTPKESKMLYDFLPELAREKKLFGYLFTGQWIDIHTPEKYELAKRVWKGIL